MRSGSRAIALDGPRGRPANPAPRILAVSRGLLGVERGAGCKGDVGVLDMLGLERLALRPGGEQGMHPEQILPGEQGREVHRLDGDEALLRDLGRPKIFATERTASG